MFSACAQCVSGGPDGLNATASALPLLFTAMEQGRLRLRDIRSRLHDNVATIFGLQLPSADSSYIEVEVGRSSEVSDEGSVFNGTKVNLGHISLRALTHDVR